jgi:hypothetical protein
MVYIVLCDGDMGKQEETWSGQSLGSESGMVG